MTKNKQYPEYDGAMSPQAKCYVPEHISRGYKIYYTARNRCTNPKIREFKWYGAKGVKIEYTIRQFLYWWDKQIQKKQYVRPSVDRIDHNKNYSFDNIRLVELSDNIKERNMRHGNPGHVRSRRIDVFNRITGGLIETCPSAKHIERVYGVGSSQVIAICKRKPKRNGTRSGLTFRYSEG